MPDLPALLDQLETADGLADPLPSADGRPYAGCETAGQTERARVP
jgi:hypothetical protein